MTANTARLAALLMLTSALTFPLAGCLEDTMQTAQETSATAPGTSVCRAPTNMPLFDDLGTHEHKITTTSKETQAYFNQGYRLLFNFNHAAAIASFQEGLRRDPKCAMCWWGIAFAYGPNINMPMMPDANTPAWQALKMAEDLAPGASDAEQAYIAALGKRYAEKPPEDRSPLDRAFAGAMRDVAKKYPNDLDAQTLYAEALMDTSPWNYWQNDKKTPNQGLEDLEPTLERVIAASPNHPGAIHLYIHAMEVPFPKKAEKAADRLTTLLPGAGHLVHMPSHIYNRIGRYDDAIVWNKKAAKADEAYFARTNDRGMYAAMYYVHNLHFVWTAATTEGRSETAIEYAKHVTSNVQPQMARDIPGIEVFTPTLTYTYLRFGKWDEVLAQPKPDETLHYATAIYHYARARAFAAKGNVREAKAEQAQIVSAFKAQDDQRFQNFGVPGRMLVTIADNIAQADIALAENNTSRAVQNLKVAVQTQDNLPYTEPPWWDFPVRQYLGAALMRDKQYAEAAAVYRDDLKEWTQNGWSLYGLSEALRHSGKRREAGQITKAYQQAWARADVKLTESRF